MVRGCWSPRRQSRLEQLREQLRARGVEVHCVTGDIAHEATRDELLDQVSRLWGALDVLINNAGVGAVGPFAAADPQRLRQIMEVNFFAPAELTRHALPLLRCGERPIVVNIGSILGHCAVPGKSEYCASKFALHGWNDALGCELLREGIDVLLVSPSTTRSEFFDHLLERQGEHTVRRLRMSPDRVACKTLTAIRRGRAAAHLDTQRSSTDLVRSPVSGFIAARTESLCVTPKEW